MAINLDEDINTTIDASEDVNINDSTNPLQNELNNASEQLRLTDDYGDEFNPEIHDVDKDGNPKKTKTGKFRKKTKGKSKKGNAVGEETSQENLVLAATCYDIYKRGHMLFGCEDLALSDDKKTAHQMDMGTVQALAKYFDYKNVEVSPGVAVLLALGNVSLTLVKRNSEVIKKKATWKVIGSKFKNMFKKKTKKEKVINPSNEDKNNDSN